MRTDFISFLVESANDPTKEAELLRAMLDAPLYAHVPLSDDSDRLRFIQFVRPDNGKTVLPIFSEKCKADEAAGCDVRVICMQGRELLAATIGATLMLDPNHRDCVFYPEEMEALLRDGSVGNAMSYKLEHETMVAVSHPRKIPIRMASALRATYSKLNLVQAAYLTVVRWQRDPVHPTMPHDPLHPTLFIVAFAKADEQERVLRATVAAIQPHITEPRMTIDVAVLDIEEESSHCFTKGACIFRRN